MGDCVGFELSFCSMFNFINCYLHDCIVDLSLYLFFIKIIEKKSLQFCSNSSLLMDDQLVVSCLLSLKNIIYLKHEAGVDSEGYNLKCGLEYRISRDLIKKILHNSTKNHNHSCSQPWDESSLSLIRKTIHASTLNQTITSPQPFSKLISSNNTYTAKVIQMGNNKSPWLSFGIFAGISSYTRIMTRLYINKKECKTIFVYHPFLSKKVV